MCINVSGTRGFVCQRFRLRSIHPSIHPSIHFVNHLNYDFYYLLEIWGKVRHCLVCNTAETEHGVWHIKCTVCHFFFFFATSLSIKANKTEDVVSSTTTADGDEMFTDDVKFETCNCKDHNATQ